MTQSVLKADVFLTLEKCIPHQLDDMSFVVGSYTNDCDEPIVCAMMNVCGNIVKVTSDLVSFLPYDLNVCYYNSPFPYLNDDLCKIIKLLKYGQETMGKMIKKVDMVGYSENSYFLQRKNLDVTPFCSYHGDVFLENIPVPLTNVSHGTIRECDDKVFLTAIGSDILPSTVLGRIHDISIRISNFDRDENTFTIFNKPVLSVILPDQEEGISLRRTWMSNFKRHETWIKLDFIENDMAEVVSYMKQSIKKYYSNEFKVPKNIRSLICVPVGTDDSKISVSSEIDEIASVLMFSMMLAVIKQLEEGDLVTGHEKKKGMLPVVMKITYKNLFSNTSVDCCSSVFDLFTVCFKIIQEILLCSSVNETVTFHQLPVVQKKIMEEFSSRWDSSIKEMNCQNADFFEICESLKKYWDMYNTAPRKEELKYLFRSSFAFPLTFGMTLYRLIHLVFKSFSKIFLRDNRKDFIHFCNDTRSVLKCLKERDDYPFNEVSEMLEETLSLSFSKIQQQTLIPLRKYRESCLCALHFICYCLLQVCSECLPDISVVSVNDSMQYLLEELFSYMDLFKRNNEWKIEVSWFDKIDQLMGDVSITSDALTNRDFLFLHKCCGDLGMPNFMKWYAAIFMRECHQQSN